MRREIIADLAEFVRGQSSLEDFEGRIVSRIQDVLDSRDQDLISIVNDIDADLVQLGEGLIDEHTLRQRAEEYLNRLIGVTTIATSVGSPANETVTVATSANTINTPRELVFV